MFIHCFTRWTYNMLISDLNEVYLVTCCAGSNHQYPYSFTECCLKLWCPCSWIFILFILISVTCSHCPVSRSLGTVITKPPCRLIYFASSACQVVVKYRKQNVLARDSERFHHKNTRISLSTVDISSDRLSILGSQLHICIIPVWHSFKGQCLRNPWTKCQAGWAIKMVVGGFGVLKWISSV